MDTKKVKDILFKLCVKLTSIILIPIIFIKERIYTPLKIQGKIHLGLYPVPKIGTVYKLSKKLKAHLEHKIMEVKLNRLRAGDMNVFTKTSDLEKLLETFKKEDIVYVFDYKLDIYGNIRDIIVRGKYAKYLLCVTNRFDLMFEELGEDIETYKLLYDDPTVSELRL